MLKIGITGQNGFIGSHLYNTLGLYPEKFACVNFSKEYFEDSTKLKAFVSECDVIVHLAAMNRHNDPSVIYETNIMLVKSLIDACETTSSTPHILFSSSTQENNDNLYGLSKKKVASFSKVGRRRTMLHLPEWLFQMCSVLLVLHIIILLLLLSVIN